MYSHNTLSQQSTHTTMESISQPKNNKKATKIALIGLDPTFSKKDLVNFFKEKFNSTSKCTFLPTSKKKKKKFKAKGKANMSSVATLILENQQEAEKILKIGRFEYKGRSFLAKPFMDRKNLKKFQKSIKLRRVFVHNIHRRITSNRLFQAFHQVCDIEEAYVIKKSRSGYTSLTNYGYVTFRNIEEAKKMIKIGNIIIEGWRVNIAPFREKNGAVDSRVSKNGKGESKRAKVKNEKGKSRGTDDRGIQEGCQKKVNSSPNGFGPCYPRHNSKINDLVPQQHYFHPVEFNQDQRTKDRQEEQEAQKGTTNLRQTSQTYLKRINGSSLINYCKNWPCRIKFENTLINVSLPKSLKEELEEFGSLRLNHSGENLRLNKDESGSARSSKREGGWCPGSY